MACWSYTHGLASLWLHGVLHTRSDPTSEQLVRRTLPAFAQLIEAARRE
ncbi:hypothetical protein IMZ29_05640 [Achromobacter sp. GG226]|nr:hypothetical protein [Verticiella sp. GG226]MBU4610042.1 hypothetical protein [Verticiella sp. GG226]